jgi:hypothetical protein
MREILLATAFSHSRHLHTRRTNRTKLSVKRDHTWEVSDAKSPARWPG